MWQSAEGVSSVSPQSRGHADGAGSQSHSLTSAGHCRCKRGLIVLQVGEVAALEDSKLSLAAFRDGIHFSWAHFFPQTTFSSVLAATAAKQDIWHKEMFAHAHRHTHTLIHTHLWWTALHVQSAGEVNEEARSVQQRGPKRLRGQMSVPHMRPCGVGGVFCPCAVTVSHTTNPHPRPFLVLSLSCRPPPIHPSPCPLVNARSLRQGSSLWWGHPGHTLATAVLNGFLRGYNQRRQAGQRLGQLEEGMLQRTEKMEEHI